MSTFTVKANVSENRLYITIKGVYTFEDNLRYAEVLKAECKKLKKGFTCLQDIREFSVLDPEVAKEAEKNKQMAEDLGLGKNAMIINSVILKGQMNRTFNTESDSPTRFFDNIDDAMKYLNS